MQTTYVRLSFQSLIFSQLAVFFSHNKLTNSTFSRLFSAQRTCMKTEANNVTADYSIHSFNQNGIDLCSSPILLRVSSKQAMDVLIKKFIGFIGWPSTSQFPYQMFLYVTTVQSTLREIYSMTLHPFQFILESDYIFCFCTLVALLYGHELSCNQNLHHDHVNLKVLGLSHLFFYVCPVHSVFLDLTRKGDGKRERIFRSVFVKSRRTSFAFVPGSDPDDGKRFSICFTRICSALYKLDE
jgi:hypothetical protein